MIECEIRRERKRRKEKDREFFFRSYCLLVCLLVEDFLFFLFLLYIILRYENDNFNNLLIYENLFNFNILK